MCNLFFTPPAPIHLMKKENPLPQLHENPQQGADGKQQTETKVKFYKKTRIHSTVLYYLIYYLRYASYCIALDLEEINYLYLYFVI
jgi:hypothetical protein